MSAFAGVATYAGANAPDRLELGIIPHRTITHWSLGWLILIMAAIMIPSSAPLTVLIVFFSIGALVHISGDALTPMGVPVWHPYKRKALALRRLSPMGTETLWVACFVLIGAGCWMVRG